MIRACEGECGRVDGKCKESGKMNDSLEYGF